VEEVIRHHEEIAAGPDGQRAPATASDDPVTD
jgi:hypothetical protein